VYLTDYAPEGKDNARIGVRQEFGINSADPVIVFASMNFAIKGLDAILLALAD